MVIQKSGSMNPEEGLVICVYGPPKVGKTSFAASMSFHGKTMGIDFERGTKYLAENGFPDVDVLQMADWFTAKDQGELVEMIEPYEYIFVDPVGEAMEFLINGQVIRSAKFRQSDGSLTTAGWGEAKKQLRSLIKFLKNTGKTVVLIFHDDRIQLEGELYHSMMIATKLKAEIPGMVDIISYIGVQRNEEGTPQRIMYTPAAGGNFDSGDRTGRMPERIILSKEDGWGDFQRAFTGQSEQELIQSEVEREATEERPAAEEEIIEV